MSKPKAWLFLDFDNTMMATEHLALPSLIARFNELYEDQIGRPLTEAEFHEHFHGQARQSLCLSMSKHFGIKVEGDLLYHQREWRMMQMLQQKGVDMAPDLLETLTLLQKSGVKLAFVSNNSIQRALAAMRYSTNGRGEELARLFGTAYFEAGDVQKPAPDIYLRALKQLQADPQESYAVEDSVTGVKAAVAAGITTFAYTGFAGTINGCTDELEKKLMAAGARTCFAHWNDFPALLKKEQESATVSSKSKDSSDAKDSSVIASATGLSTASGLQGSVAHAEQLSSD
ncbi:MAG: HAD family phosphatase [Candidatus Obscuribacter sp.]|nr:HAD family phosphatase [Candidatus Obscuribacter sp.]